MGRREGKVIFTVLVVLGVLVIGGFLVYGKSLFRLAQVRIEEATEDLQPDVATQVKMLEKDLEDFADDGLEKDFTTVSKAETNARQQKETYERSTRILERMRADIEKIQTDLKGSNNSFTYGGVTWSREQLIDKLDQLLNQYERKLAVVDTQKEIALSAQNVYRECELAAENKVQSFEDARLQLEQIRARQAKIEAQAIRSQYVISDGSLGRIKKSIGDISAKLDAKERVLAIDNYVPLDNGRVDRPTENDVLARSQELLQQ